MDAAPHEIRALARRVVEQGEEVRADARDMIHRSRAVGWTGLAGAGMVGNAHVRARLLDEIGARHQTAARALEAHAAAVEESLALIAEIERRVTQAAGAARHRLGRFLHGLVDAVDPCDEVLASFSAPPPGSPLWLEVRLPGVALPARLR